MYFLVKNYDLLSVDILGLWSSVALILEEHWIRKPVSEVGANNLVFYGLNVSAWPL